MFVFVFTLFYTFSEKDLPLHLLVSRPTYCSDCDYCTN